VTRPRFQERCARWLLLLALVHTIPVVWITPVVAGTAPAAALLALGGASLLAFSREGAAFALFFLGPALIYSGLGWSVAWLLGKLLERLGRGARACLLAALAVAPLLSVYAPIYVAGGHTSSRSANLVELCKNTIDPRLLLGYWIALHAVLAALYAGHLLRDGSPILRLLDRWRRPALATAAVVLAGAVLYGSYPRLICRPLAGLGSARAQLCLARNDSRDRAYWYERAAAQGQPEAIAWMIENTHDRAGKLEWLRKGAEQGDGAIQLALHERLMRDGAVEEASVWLHRAAEGGHLPALLALVEELSRTVYATQSVEMLAERNAWLERAARAGAREARLQLASHHVDGSMGYPADLARARALYRQLAGGGPPTPYERTLGLDAAYYRARIAELESWEKGLAGGDPATSRTLARLYLESQMPGPGVRDRGVALLERLAATGDAAAREDLIVVLRTGDRGIARDPAAAGAWLIRAAEAGDAQAMERVAAGFMSGQEGFPVDYPEARRWLGALIEHHTGGDAAALAQVRRLERELAYIDRLEQDAGGPLLGERELIALGRGTDAESHYRYALQLLVGHGPQRRAEALARLREAARQGHGDAAWRLFQVHERGFPDEVDPAAALEQLQLAVANHHFDATRELAMSYEYGKRGLATDLPRAIALYESALDAGRDNRYGWNLDPGNYNHFSWVESRLKQARAKLDARAPGPRL